MNTSNLINTVRLENRTTFALNSSKGGAIIMFQYDEKQWRAGWAICSPEDQFVRGLGNTLARNRMMECPWQPWSGVLNAATLEMLGQRSVKELAFLKPEQVHTEPAFMVIMGFLIVADQNFAEAIFKQDRVLAMAQLQTQYTAARSQQRKAHHEARKALTAAGGSIVPLKKTERVLKFSEMVQGVEEQVKFMNMAYGNQPMDIYSTPKALFWERLRNQCEKNILSEYNELMLAISERNITGVRDALGDICVFTIGGAHLANAPFTDDMSSIFDSNMSKFCRNQEELDATYAKYAALNVELVHEGAFPTVRVRSAKEQMFKGEIIPEGKVLKGVAFKEPVFKPLR